MGRYSKFLTSYAHAYLTYLSRTSRTHCIHQPIPFLSSWACALGLLTAYALESKVGWAPARREQTNKRPPDMSGHILGQSVFALKTAHTRVGSVTPSNARFLRCIRVHIPHGISTGSALFAQLTWQSVPILYIQRHLSRLKIVSSHGGSATLHGSWS